MSRHWAVVLVAVTCLSVGTMFGALVAPRPIEAAKEPQKTTPVRIGYVNIAKLLREFRQANADGEAITKKRQEYVDKVKPLRDKVAANADAIKAANSDAEKERLEKEAVKLNRDVEDFDREAQRVLSAMTDRTVVEVYERIRAVIREMANERGLDVVECYPDESGPGELKKPAVAQIKLQTPALIPYYLRPELDLTDEVVARLNKKYVPAKDN